MKILSKIINNKDIINKEYADSGMSALEQRILALENDKRATEVPIGTIISYASSTAPEGYLKCEGQEVSRTTYSQLFNAIGTTYGAGDGSTTFKLPDLREKFLKGSTTAGTVEYAGLPNITGGFYAYAWETGRATGTFSSSLATEAQVPNGGAAPKNYINFSLDASQSNSIYGNSTTVTPENVSVLYCIKYKTYSNIITIDDKYPVGSIYISVDSANPSTLFGGTWVSIGEGRTLIGAGSNTVTENSASKTYTFTGGSTGTTVGATTNPLGEYQHKLTVDEMPSHNHNIFSNWDDSNTYKDRDWFYDINSKWKGTGYCDGSGTWAISPEGGSQIHNNIQPYIVVYMWKRTA